ncbi:hypothetical protein Prudu_010086 [Prunus dulcis]|uniref:Uncharacterized protein n=1 Tax=Prunus dulcis TaxID=3755 RepID=A0A4Y1R7R0_PRUDU|nr:hypothetical protein Prudu_010086 [Prunus dulcis]
MGVQGCEISFSSLQIGYEFIAEIFSSDTSEWREKFMNVVALNWIRTLTCTPWREEEGGGAAVGKGNCDD